MPSEKRQRQKAREQASREARLAAERRRQQRRTWMTIGGLVVLVVALAALYSFLGGEDGDEPVETTDDTQPVDEGDDDTGQYDADADDGDEGSDPAAGDAGDDDSGDDEAAAEPVECPAEDGSSEQRLEFPAAPPECIEEDATYEAVFDTTAGEIRVALDTETTPDTVNNFVYLARYGYYDDTELFRSNTGIDILQGGAPHTNSPSDPGPGYTIPDEGDSFTYEPGDLAMARTPAPNSASAQFFFSTGPETSQLDGDGTYVVFGEVIEGMDVLEDIMASHEDAEGGTPGEGAPDPIPVINDVEIVQT